MPGPHDVLDDLKSGEEHAAHPHVPDIEDHVPEHDTQQPKYTNAAPQRYDTGDDDDSRNEGPSLRERASDRAREEGGKRLREKGRDLKDRLFDKGGPKGAEEGLGQGAKKGIGNLAEGGIEQGGKKLAEEGVKAGTQAAVKAGTQVATEAGLAAAEAGVTAAAEGTAVAAGAAATPETAGVGLVVGAVVAGGIWAATHWKGVAITVAGMFVLGIIAFAYVANIFKPIASTFMNFNKFGSSMQSIVNFRSVPILGDFAFKGSAASKAAGHQLDADKSGKAGKLFKAMRENGFEERIKSQYGVSFAAGASSGAISINKDGKVLGEAKNSQEATEILRNNPTMTGDIINNDVQAWDWAQHFKVARPMKSVFSVAQLHIPGAETADDGEGIVNVLKYQMTTILKPSLTGLTKTVSCFVTNKGCKDDGSDATGSPPAEQKLQDNENSSITKAAQDAYDQNLADITPENNYNVTRLDTKANANMQAQLSKATLPMLGWLDFSTATKEVSTNDDFANVPAKLRSQQAGTLALAQWSAAGQSLASGMTPKVASVLFRNFKSIEGSQGYNYVVYDDASRGKALDEDSKINSVSAQPMNLFYTAWHKVNAGVVNATPLLIAWKIIRSTALTPFILIAEHTPLVDLLTSAVTKIPGISNIFKAFVQSPLVEIVTTSFGLSSKLLLPVYDPAEQTADYGNYLSSGMQVLTNEACMSEFGCSNTLTAQQVQELKVAHTKQDEAYLASLPWTERLFSRTVPNSFINTAVLRSPIKYAATENLATAVNSLFDIVKTLPDNMARMYSQPARAASSDPTPIAGVAGNVGIDKASLINEAYSKEMETGATCPVTARGIKNTCKADEGVTDVWFARFLGYNAAVAEGL